MGKRKLFGKYDLLLFAVIILIAIIIYIVINSISSGKGAVCEIKIDGKVVRTVDLSEYDREFELLELPESPHIRFKIQNNAIAFAESDCPDKICVNTGYLSYPGQSAVCMPNRVSIHITGNNGADGADIVVN